MHRTLTALLTALVVGACLMLAPETDTIEAQSYRQRLNNIRNKQRQVQQRLSDIKESQEDAASELSSARNRAQQARDEAQQAEQNLEQVREILREVKADQAQTEEELEGHREAMSERLIALYETGQPSYLEVVLNATSFEDFTNRAEFSRIIAGQDQELLDALVETEAKLEQQRETMEVAHAEAKILEERARVAKANAEKAENAAEALVAKYRQDRKAAERDYAALEATENQIQALIRSRGSSSSGGGSYSGTCAGNLLRPCPGRVSSPYGWRIHPILRTRRFHNGVDFAIGAGTTIKASDDGKVIFAGWKGAYGRTVIIDHGSGWQTMYGHCSKIYVSRGQVVSRGQAIAAVGSTGWSTGPHLHWTVYRNGSTINPLG
ncbi:MAG: peptidoglycan DD-metalloendopeptidase family protein [Armatimonadia bacterium]|nr:peptidoglycan DD-metalloendopeptidase family protein [Armatimonadia bacterium]